MKWFNPNPAGIMGINRRNLDFIFTRNPRDRFSSVDDKITSKQLLVEAGIPVPRAIASVEQRGQIADCVSNLVGQQKFVVKPSRGFGGRGIKVIRQGPVDAEEIRFHMASILSGMFSLDLQRDRVLVEERVEESSLLTALHGSTGVSDLRIVVCDGAPVMAMLRLPCNDSGDTANLHAGGIGVGVEIGTGITNYAVQRGTPTADHPDTGRALRGHALPHWADILDMSRAVNRIFGLGYLGVDIVIDENLGPQILEVNARPGLTIQLANRMGLLAAMEAGAAED